MKTVKSFFVGAAILLSAAQAYAGCLGTVVNGRCMGTYVDNPNVGVGSSQKSSSGYSSSSGNRYQYDLSNPGDRTGYSIDLDAQRRDKMNLDPSRNIDRGVGQFGGGIYND